MSEFKVCAEGVEDKVFDDRNVALEQFRQACGRGVWAEVWEMLGANSVQKIADFPGLTRELV